jgi:hypothetical protein
MAGISVLEFGIIFVLRYFANREAELDRREEEKRLAAATSAQDEEDVPSLGESPSRLSLKGVNQSVLEVK